MRKQFAVFAIMLVAAAICVAQDVVSDADQNASQSVAAAARANREPKVDPAKAADIRHLLELTGSAALATQVMDNMEKDIKPLVSHSLPPGEYREKLVDLFFEKFRSKRDPEQLIALLIPIYDRYYTDDDIKGLITFFESPLGRKMASALPGIANESQAAGGRWGQELGRQCMIEVLAEHPELRKQLEEAKANSTGH